MLYIYIENKEFYNQIKYVFDNIFFILGPDCRYINCVNDISFISINDIYIGYYERLNKSHILSHYFSNLILIYNSGKLFGSGYLRPGSVPSDIKKYNLLEEKNIENIISIYNLNEELYVERSFSRDRKIIRTNIDIISDIFFMLTRYEEIVNAGLSEAEAYKRFPGMESLSYRKNFLNRPIVNEDCELMWSWISSFNLKYIRKRWWDDKEYAVCISHDVDFIIKYKTVKNVIRPTLELLKNKQFGKTVSNIGAFFKSRLDYSNDPYWTFEYIVNKERSIGLKSSFYFMSGGTSRLDNKYKIDSPVTRKLIKYLEDNNEEIGYHSSFNSYDDYLLMKNEKENLDKIVFNKKYGCRQHYLRFKVPMTWKIQEMTGLLYDTSLGFADSIGFRCGTCFPFKPYSLLDNRIIELWEIPLLIMDVSLFKKNYNSYNAEEAYINSKNIIDKVKQYGGVFTLLWHNSSLDSYDYNMTCWKQVYENIIKYISGSNYYGVDGRSLIMLLS